jgi:hypothetical protein
MWGGKTKDYELNDSKNFPELNLLLISVIPWMYFCLVIFRTVIKVPQIFTLFIYFYLTTLSQ